MAQRRSPRLSAPSSPALHGAEVEDGGRAHAVGEEDVGAGPAGGSGEQDLQLFGDGDVTPHEEAGEGTTGGPSATGRDGVGDGEVGSGEFFSPFVERVVREVVSSGSAGMGSIAFQIHRTVPSPSVLLRAVRQ